MTMNVMVPIPDDLAARFGSEAELARHVVEALALEAYCAGRLTRAELQQVLGFASHGELTVFLDNHRVLDLVAPRAQNGEAPANDIVARFKAFAATHTLGGPAMSDLISEGRR